MHHIDGTGSHDPQYRLDRRAGIVGHRSAREGLRRLVSLGDLPSSSWVQRAFAVTYRQYRQDLHPTYTAVTPT